MRFRFGGLASSRPAALLRGLRSAAPGVVLCLAAAAVLAQATGVTTGDLRGRIRDEAGAPIPGVAVTAVNEETGLARSTATAGDGAFVLRLLPPGSYDLTAAQAGLQTLRLAGVVVALGTTAHLDLAMRVEPVTEAVTVEARTRAIDPTSTELAASVSEAEIRNLPINRRNYMDFALTTPGVTADRGPQSGAATTSGFSVNGQDPRSNNVLLDGLDDNDAAVGAVRSAVTQEAVREYQVIRAPYSAEYGRAGGGVVNVVTRSGSNDLSATAFLFYRDRSLSGKNALADMKTPYEQFQFGGAVSGPLLRDRLFFFAAAERLDVTDANVIEIGATSAQAIRDAGFPLEEEEVLPYGRDRTSAIAKLDAAPVASQAWALRGTWSTDTNENQQPWGGLVARSAGGVRDITDTAVGLTGISLFGAGASNEFRALYADRSHRLDSLDATGGPSVEILGVATFGTQEFLPQPRDSRTYEAFDAFTAFAGPATLKAGVDYVHTDLEGILPLYFAGFYQFVDLDTFAAGIPAVFAQGFGDPSGSVSTDLFAAFAEGEWAPSGRFLVRAGLRYEYENPADPFPADPNNWAPRLSFSWAPGEAWRVRGGLGRFYAVAPIGPMFAVGIENGQSARILLRTYLDADSPAAAWSQPDHRFADESAAGDYAPAVFEAGRFESAHTDLASLGVERDLGGGWSAALDYVHARGRSILVERNVNPLDVSTGNPTRPDPAFSEVRRYESAGNSWYEGITASVDARVGAAFQLSASYTYADARSDYIDFSVGLPQDSYPHDLQGELGPTVHVPRHRATLTAVYPTPSAGPWWARDWTFSAISEVSVGRPFNELAGYDRNFNGDPASDRPEGVGHNRGTLPAYWNVDLRVGRRIPIGPVDVDLTLDVFNLFDRANVLEVNNVRYLTGPPDLEENADFGTPTRLADPTRLQLGLRLRF